MANDMQIRGDVLAALGRENTVTAGTIGVEVHHGVVKLSGCVNDHAIKEDAERAAGRVEDVTAVVMNVDVAGAGARPPAIV
jgi:osmotically-inducible protein OsmY